jgi:ABC-type transporter Mla maintaining outer membrane lipid asymmetry ATPase subunit MlaF
MSTHDIFRAKEVADVVAIMDRGRIIMQRSAAELADHDLQELYMQYMAGHEEEGVVQSGELRC